VGTYKIEFFCKDKAGNKDCDWKKGAKKHRMVYVKDTLPPVISLHLNDETIAYGKDETVGLNGIKNPAGNPNWEDHPDYDGNKNTNLMAEESASASTNGWVLGAAASAITGLALLGYSVRRNTAATVSVPV